MKKLLAAGCAVLAFHNVSQVTLDQELLNPQGQRVLVKALAVLANTENYRKVPPKRIHLPHADRPR